MPHSREGTRLATAVEGLTLCICEAKPAVRRLVPLKDMRFALVGATRMWTSQPMRP